MSSLNFIQVWNKMDVKPQFYSLNKMDVKPQFYSSME